MRTVKNRFLEAKTERDIDGQVSKILRGLSNPTTAIELADVRALLELEVGSGTDRLRCGADGVENRESQVAGDSGVLTIMLELFSPGQALRSVCVNL